METTIKLEKKINTAGHCSPNFSPYELEPRRFFFPFVI